MRISFQDDEQGQKSASELSVSKELCGTGTCCADTAYMVRKHVEADTRGAKDGQE